MDTADRTGEVTAPPKPLPTEDTINNAKLLSKLGFIVAGGSPSKEGLRAALNKFLKTYSKAARPVSRQTIIHWFEKDSVPSRRNAITFLEDFLDRGVDYRALAPDQKKVVRQIKAFLQKNAEKADEQAFDKDHRQAIVKLQDNGDVVVSLAAVAEKLPRRAITIDGTFLLYRVRISEDKRNPLTQEVVRIFWQNHSLRFEQWYRRDGREIDRFEGSVLLIGDVFWFLGGSTRDGLRFRVMAFRSNSGYPEDNKTVLWGLMLTDNATIAKDEPAAIRILLVETQPPKGSFIRFASERCRSFNLKTDHLPQKELIWRLIDNTVTALSKPQGTEPVTSSDGTSIIDPMLRVSLSTLTQATVQLQDHV